MTACYIVSGICFTGDRLLPELPSTGFSDLDINVVFTDIPATTNLIQGPDDSEGSFDKHTGTLALLDQGDDSANAWLLRQIAPIVSSVGERLVLHASAALLQQGVVAFIGESGAGKSTLAQAFSEPTADDLVPVRFRDTALVPVGDSLAPLVAVYFLERSGQELHRDPLAQATALELEITNGFGEHGDPDTWAFQFDAYHQLTQAVPHYRFTIPDDLAALSTVVEFIEGSS
jgi:hypothetical protein